MPRCARRSGLEDAVHEYVPHFVFNDAHLWAVRDRGEGASFEQYLGERQFWAEFDPSFAASVHDSIFDEALGGMSWTDLAWVKAASLAIDANLAIYDPRDHFDNAYIEDGWARVGKRLATGGLNDFALACHAIGDFYAHSSWGVFGERKDGVLRPFDPKRPAFSTSPDYTEDERFPIQESRFSVNEPVWGSRPRSEEPDLWEGQIISGRYAQDEDPHQGAAERVTYIPKALRRRGDYAKRAGLPHHNEIAVDSDARSQDHRLYDNAVYKEAFAERYSAAVAHIRSAYAAWKAARKEQ